MRIQILNTEGEVVNTIIADEAFCNEYYPGLWRIEPEPEVEDGPADD